MKTLRAWNYKQSLRRWQERAIRRFHALDAPDFLGVATPGGGKTFFALKCAHDLLSDGKIERVVVVTPTEHLKRQWAEAAAAVGIDIDPSWSNSDGSEASDYWGVAVSYQQVSFAPDLYELNCRRRTLVIFDEVHHAGDNLDWGVKLRSAFRRAAYRLSVSGTPFRNDDQQIPFVSYAGGRSQADFTYGYGEALADGVCRPVYFPTVEGQVAWLRANGAEVNCSLLDDLSKQKAAERLRAVLDPGGRWVADVLREADTRLSEIRADGGHADAAGLVIAIDQFHARQIAAILKSISNEQPTLAISDEENSSNAIREFARKGSRRRWIVAVKMVSEGVDIPRLRVGVYATTVMSELFFRQAVGRFVRVVPGIEEQSAAFYLPADATLIRHALAIKEEREHYLRQIIKAERADGQGSLPILREKTLPFAGENLSGDEEKDSNETGNQENAPAELPVEDDNQIGGGRHPNFNTRSFIVPLSSDARPFDTIFDGSRFSPVELDEAAQIGRELGVFLPSAQVAAILRRGGVGAARSDASEETDGKDLTDSPILQQPATDEKSSNAASSGSASPTLKTDRKSSLRREINRLANKLAHRTGAEFNEIHRRWIREMSGTGHGAATGDELRRKHRWLVEEFEKAIA